MIGLRRPGLLSAALLLIGAAATPMPLPLVLPLFATIGFALGVTGPSRDLIVRGATPKGAAGRIYGFVYSGLDLGGTIGPIVFGFMLDHALAHDSSTRSPRACCSRSARSCSSSGRRRATARPARQMG